LPLADHRIIERSMADIAGILNEQEFDSIEEANTHLRALRAAGELPRRRPASPLERAQDLIYDAWEAEGAERVELARRALQISPDCADAFVLLADEAARSLQEALELNRQGVAAGERALGPKAFEAYKGEFWGVLETRPYMRARFGLAQCLWEAEQRREAIDHYWDMLRLNPGDNQGVRYVLLACLLEVGHQADVKDLLDRYADDIAASWAYGRALFAFREHGDTSSARALLVKAKQANAHVPAYLLGTKRLPSSLPDHIGIGDEPEGIACAAEQILAWSKTPNALAWLERSLGESGAAAAADERQTVPHALRPHFDALVRLTDAVCQERLNEEYAQLCRRLAAALCRKRPSPVIRGRPEIWACAITYAVGSVNFLFDRAEEPHLTAAELCALFEVSPRTVAAKASEVRRMFRMGPFDLDWCLPSKLDEHPLTWLISVDGIIVDAPRPARRPGASAPPRPDPVPARIAARLIQRRRRSEGPEAQ